MSLDCSRFETIDDYGPEGPDCLPGLQTLEWCDQSYPPEEKDRDESLNDSSVPDWNFETLLAPGPDKRH